MSPIFYRKFDRWLLEDSKSVRLRCEKCGNTNNHVVMVDPDIPLIQLGPFGKKPLLSINKYYLTCSICGHDAKELTKNQADALKGK